MVNKGNETTRAKKVIKNQLGMALNKVGEMKNQESRVNPVDSIFANTVKIQQQVSRSHPIHALDPSAPAKVAISQGTNQARTQPLTSLGSLALVPTASVLKTNQSSMPLDLNSLLMSRSLVAQQQQQQQQLQTKNVSVP